MEKKLNRLQKRANVLELYGKSFDIFDVCDSVHGSITGSSDPLLTEELNKSIQFLQTCLDTWAETPWEETKEYDNAVKNLIIATINETNGKVDKE